jgi:hypothetical protein
MFDLLDEGPLAPTDIDKLTRMVLHATPDDVELPDLKQVGPRNFIRAVERRLETAPTLVFNPLTARMAPAIDVNRLRIALHVCGPCTRTFTKCIDAYRRWKHMRASGKDRVVGVVVNEYVDG